MAGVVNFKARITDLAGALTVTDDSGQEQWMLDGCYDVIAKLKKINPDLVQMFLDSGSVVDGTGYSISSKYGIYAVLRGLIQCAEVPVSRIKSVIDPASIYLATADAPVFYISGMKVYILPAPAASPEDGTILHIPNYVINNFSTGTSSIISAGASSFPVEYYDHVILYAAIQTILAEMMYVYSLLPNYNSTIVSTTDVDTQIGADDPVLANVEVAKISLELQDQNLLSSGTGQKLNALIGKYKELQALYYQKLGMV